MTKRRKMFMKKNLGFRTVVLPLALVFLFFGNSKSFGEVSAAQTDDGSHIKIMVFDPVIPAEPDCGVNPAECSTRIFEYDGKTFNYDATTFYCLPLDGSVPTHNIPGIERDRDKEGKNDPFAQKRAMDSYAKRCLAPPIHIN